LVEYDIICNLNRLLRKVLLVLKELSYKGCTDAMATAPNNRPITINTKSYENLMFLPFEIEKSCWSWFLHLQITVKPVVGDRPFVKLKVVAQNRWLLKEGLPTGSGIVTI